MNCCIRCGKPITAEEIIKRNSAEGNNPPNPPNKAKAFVNRYCADCAAKLPLLDVITAKESQ